MNMIVKNAKRVKLTTRIMGAVLNTQMQMLKMVQQNASVYIAIGNIKQSLIKSDIYMDDWEKFNETSLPAEKDFYSYLNMKDITDLD